jgi:hypothetical protein
MMIRLKKLKKMKRAVYYKFNVLYRICFITFTIILSSCRSHPPKVEEALDQAGNNRQELLSVIAHYSNNPNDTLKLEAAYFLISNMPGKFFYEGELLDKYYEFIADVGASPSVLDSIKSRFGPFSLDKLKKKYDINELKASFLISNIDWAFHVWKKRPWGKDIDFDQFCEYILPYRIGNEVPAYNRAEFYKRYNSVLDSADFKHADALKACYAVNNVLQKEGWSFVIQGGFLPNFSAHKLLDQRKGNCRDMVSKTIFIMRSLGIPVGMEFTPNWGNRNGGHLWNVVLDKHGQNHPFMGTENNDSRELEGGTHYTFPKIFLQTFGSQDYNSYLMQNAGNDIPEFFKNSNIKDVTNEVKGSEHITVTVDAASATPEKFVYLCVFDNIKWIPVDWAEVSHHKAVFKNVMGNIVYLVGSYKNGLLTPVNYPFILKPDHKFTSLKPDAKQRKAITLSRKYPVFMKTDYAKHMMGGKMQAADNRLFLNPHTFYTIPFPETEMKWYDIPVKVLKPYKYYRYLSPENGFGNIAELQFYNGGKQVIGVAIGSPGSYANIPENFFTAAFDGDEATTFNYKEASHGWAGMKFSKAIKIDKIRFLPRNDDNGIAIGQTYQLMYWQNNDWVSAGKQIATTDKLTFKNVPDNSLLILHNLSKGKEERIFTYEREKQIWW